MLCKFSWFGFLDILCGKCRQPSIVIETKRRVEHLVGKL